MGCVMRTARGYLFLNFSRSLSLKGCRITCNGGMRLKAALYLLNLYTIFNKYTSKTVFILGKSITDILLFLVLFKFWDIWIYVIVCSW